jgi:hypothetical protein
MNFEGVRPVSRKSAILTSRTPCILRLLCFQHFHSFPETCQLHPEFAQPSRNSIIRLQLGTGPNQECQQLPPLISILVHNHLAKILLRLQLQPNLLTMTQKCLAPEDRMKLNLACMTNPYLDSPLILKTLSILA